MRDHHFNPQHAVKYGVNAAIVLHSIVWWIEKNIANKKHFHDGRTWTYNSITAWATLCPYLSKKQVRTSLELLRSEGVLIVGNYSDNPKDQTLWYALVDEDQYIDPEVKAKALAVKDRARRGKDQDPQGKSYKGTDISTVINTVTNTPLPPSGDEISDGDNFFEKENNTNTGAAGREVEIDLQSRMAKFRAEVMAVGATVYTQLMLDNFINYYSQPDGAKKPKMAWEKKRQKVGWKHESQLKAWATRNIDGIQCYLTEDQKTIAEKRQAFAKSLEPYMQQYGREFLLEFYRYWSVPENVPNPQYLRWEKEEFWELATRLADRFSKWNKPKY